MKSIKATRPSAVSKTVSSSMVPSWYARLIRGTGSAGQICQRPCSDVPSRAAKHALLSKRLVRGVPDGYRCYNESAILRSCSAQEYGSRRHAGTDQCFTHLEHSSG
jgi:hypothetical protein